MSIIGGNRFAQGRGRRGQSVTILMIFLATFVLLPLSLFSFELARYALAKQQLKACVDSCALAAAATNASGNSTNPTVTQTAAIATAMNMFRTNTILGYSLSGTSQASALPLNPTANQALLYFQFLDPVTRQPVALGSTDAEIIQVTAAYGVVPAFARFLHLNSVYPAVEMANGGLPTLDVVLCFDISASMDDFTPISIVNRYKNGSYNGYSLISQGPLYTAFKCTGPTGSPLNATFPQTLDCGDGSYTFNTSYRGTNYGVAAAGAVSTQYTDVIVNIDGTNTFSSGTTVNYSGSSYVFPAGNVGCLVEAARGNLESTAIATTAKVPYSTWGITPKAGYFQAYVQAAFGQRHPIGDAISAAQNFFSIMNNDCDVHLGLVSFGSSIGSSSTSTCSSDVGYSGIGSITDNPSTYKSNSYPTDPLSPSPPNPEIDLIPTAGSAYSNYSQVSAAVTPLLAYGGTNIAGALNCAVQQLTPTASGGRGLARKNAAKAIVLFTDGLPTESSLGGDPTADARAQASTANQAGIPIYCIGLCMVSSLQANQTAVLTDTNSSPTAGGIAGISGNGAQFYQATQTSDLNLAFENVARALVQLVH